MWRVKTVTKFKNSFFPVLIYWNDNRIHLNTFNKSVFVSMVPPLFVGPAKLQRGATPPSVMVFLMDKTLPEAQGTQVIDSITLIIS